MLRSQIDSFIKHLSLNETYSHNTILAYENDLMQFAQYTQNAPIEIALVKGYIDQLRRKDYASSTIARKVAAIKTFLYYLQERGNIDTNIASQINTPKVKRQVQPLLTPEQITRLLQVHDKSRGPKSLRNRVLLRLLYHTNLRITELVELQMSHFDGRSLHGFELDDALLRYVDDYLRNGRPALLKDSTQETALFLNHRGSALTRQGVWLIIKQCARRAGLKVPVTPRMLRQSFDAHKKSNETAVT